MKSTTEQASFLRTYFAIGAAISALAIIQTQIQTQALLKMRTRYKWVVLMLVLAVNLAVGIYIAVGRSGRGRFWRRLHLREINTAARMVLAAALMLLPVPMLLYARADFFGRGIEAFFRLLWLFWWFALVQALGLRLALGINSYRALAAVLLVDGVAAQLCRCTVGGAARSMLLPEERS